VNFIATQFFQTTAEDARDYFNSVFRVGSPHQAIPQVSLPAGMYRVIDGSLRRVVPGIPPELLLNSSCGNMTTIFANIPEHE
jgi:hypothetical protein